MTQLPCCLSKDVTLTKFAPFKEVADLEFSVDTISLPEIVALLNSDTRSLVVTA